MRVVLRTEGLTPKECKELLAVIEQSEDVSSAILIPPLGVMMYRSALAAMSPMEILVVLGGFTASHLLANPLKDVGTGIAQQLDCVEIGRNIGHFLKSLPRRSPPYVPKITAQQIRPFSAGVRSAETARTANGEVNPKETTVPESRRT